MYTLVMDQKTNNEIFTCFHCGNRTSHKLLLMHTQKVFLTYEPYNGDEVTADNYIHFFECSTCEGITIKALFSEEIDDPRQVNFDRVTSLYPQEKSFPEEMPTTIIKAYKEASKVKKISDQAFVILIRKGLEILCEDQKISGKSLAEKIKKMIEKGMLPGSFAQMVDSIRILGNIGAHDLSSEFTKEQIETIDYFFIAVLEYVYIAPHKLEKLMTSISSKKAS